MRRSVSDERDRERRRRRRRRRRSICPTPTVGYLPEPGSGLEKGTW